MSAFDSNGLMARVMRRRRFVMTIAIASLLISLAGIPAATARSGHKKPVASESAPAPSTAAVPTTQSAATPSAADGEGGGEGAATKAAKHAKKPAKATPQDSGASGSGAAGSSQPEAGHRHATGGGAKRAKETQGAGGSTKQAGGGPEVTPAAKSKGKRAEPGTETERRRLKEHAGKPTSSHGPRSKAKQVEAARPTSLPGAGGSGTTESGTPVASTAPSPAPLTAAAVIAASTPSSQLGGAPAGASTRAATTTHAGARTRRVRAARGSGSGAVSATAAAGLLGVGTGTQAAGTRARPNPAARHHARGGSSSPLARTITRIVGVVPTPIRVLIAALLALALVLGIRSRLAARRARRLERQRTQLLEDVGLLQAALLPVPPARLGPVGTTAAYRPAAGPGAGGDFYDVFALDDGQLAVIVGDVSGHGREALPHTALVRFTLRAYLEAGLSPRGAVQTAGAVLEHQLGSSFATVVAATYNPRERLLVYASAGHPPPLVIGSGGERAALEPVTVCSAPPVGTGLATGTRQSVIAVPGGAQICFYTDGVTEARVGTQLFGPRRLASTLAEVGRGGDAAELLDRVCEQADSRPDDMAACLLSIEGGAGAPHALSEEIELDRESVASQRVEQFLLACGVEPAEAAAVLRAAAAAVERAGSVVLELHRADGHARVTFQNDNLAYLHTRHAARQADRMVTR